MKQMVYRIFALIFLIILFPVFLILYILVKTSSKGPFLFKQKRLGKNKKMFIIYKIRTMVENAEKIKKKYSKMNEAEFPVFKIRNDPRYIGLGKFLSHTGLDELPQLFNVLKGEMSFVGPRPLPLDEGLKLTKKHQQRFAVLPGMTSDWVIRGSHKLGLKKWMEMDINYVKNANFFTDIRILLKTLFLFPVLFLKR